MQYHRLPLQTAPFQLYGLLERVDRQWLNAQPAQRWHRPYVVLTTSAPTPDESESASPKGNPAVGSQRIEYRALLAEM